MAVHNYGLLPVQLLGDSSPDILPLSHLFQRAGMVLRGLCHRFGLPPGPSSHQTACHVFGGWLLGPQHQIAEAEVYGLHHIQGL